MAHNESNRRIVAKNLELDSIQSELSAIAELPLDGLREAWKVRFANHPPPVRSRVVLRQLFAWHLQSEAIGGLDSATERALTKIGKALRRDSWYEPKIRGGFSPGVVLTREWKGAVHKVTVTADGYLCAGKKYRSLSDIARTITGTRWSGPRFFGLEQKAQRRMRRTPS